MTTLREEFAVDLPAEVRKDAKLLQSQAEAARFNVHMAGLVTRDISKSWTEKQRSDDVKREIAALRAVVGAREEPKWIPAPLCERLLTLVSKK